MFFSFSRGAASSNELPRMSIATVSDLGCAALRLGVDKGLMPEDMITACWHVTKLERFRSLPSQCVTCLIVKLLLGSATNRYAQQNGKAVRTRKDKQRVR